MAAPLAADLRRLGLVVVPAGLAGWAAGHLAAGLAAGLAVALAWHFAELLRIRRWLDGGAGPPARRHGLLAGVHARVDRLQRQARKRKKRLRKLADRFHQAEEANPDGAIVIDGGDRIEWLNRAASRMLGLRQGQDHGQPIGNLMRQTDFADWIERHDAVDPYELDSPVTTGQRLLLRQVPYGSSKRMLMVRDITRLHSLEQMRRDFVANVSHELRSPLTVVVGYLESISEDADLPQRYRRPVAQMTVQSARMARIVEDLLGLSRIESDPGAADRQPLDMGELVAAIVRDASRISTAQHRIDLQVREDLLLLANYNEIYSALSNLVFNAVQYTPPVGDIAITWALDEDGAGLFTVRDSGVGIEAHHIPRLTERFYRVDKARSRELGGTGLGLAIVKHVLLRHDATLDISSEPGEGSTFRCRFPADRVQLATGPLDEGERDAAPEECSDPPRPG